MSDPDFFHYRGRTLEREPRSTTWVHRDGDDSRVESLEIWKRVAEGKRPDAWLVTFAIRPAKGDSVMYIEADYGSTPEAAFAAFDVALAELRRVFP